MICRNCGHENSGQSAFCVHCGATMQQEAPAAVQAPVAVQPQQPMIPEEYRPLGPWKYFALSLLFSIPVVGFIFLIIFSCNGSNINRRNFARSYWCSLIIAAGAFLVILLFMLALGFTTADVMSEMMYY